MRGYLLLFLWASLLTGCTTVSPEARVRTKLIEAGLKPKMADCMAERLVDRLSIAQLKRLGSLGKLQRDDPRTMTIDDFLYRLRALDDPEIVKVVTKAGFGCAIAV
jgi:hypothetical protein